MAGDKCGFITGDARYRNRSIATNKVIVLGSSSIWRRKVLEEAEIPFKQLAADIDEKAIRFPRAEDLVRNIAAAKAGALLQSVKEPSLLITADQVVVWCGFGSDARINEIREKPRDAEEARQFLQSARETGWIESVTAVVVTDTATRRSRSVVDVLEVNVGSISDSAIDRAIKRGDILNSCGAFTIEDPDIGHYFSKADAALGDREFHTSVAGLPIAKTIALLEHFGWRRP